MSKSEIAREKKEKKEEKQVNGNEEFYWKLLPFPVYTVDSQYYEDLSMEVVIAAGGGGRAKTGIPNGFVCHST